MAFRVATQEELDKKQIVPRSTSIENDNKDSKVHTYHIVKTEG